MTKLSSQEIIERLRNSCEDANGLFDRRDDRERYIAYLEKRVEDLSELIERIEDVQNEQAEINFLNMDKHGR